MKVGIIGGGALGSLFASFFTNDDVHLLEPVNLEHGVAINRDGLVVLEEESTHTARVRVSARPDEIGMCDVVLLCVKAPFTREALASARALVGPHTLLVSLQNGFGITEILSEFVPAERVFRGVTSQGSTFLGPGKIRHAGAGKTVVGPASPSASPEDRGRMEKLFRGAQIPFEMVASVDRLVWEKLLVNVGINALTGIFDVRNGVLVQDEELRSVLRAAVGEAVAVARAEGVPFDLDAEVKRVEEVARITGENVSSMLQDVRARRVTEIDFINGAVVRLGARHGVETPVNRLLSVLVRKLSERRPSD
ncbi:MAG: 2-dehydropantoate 2-reductase [Candidatus Bipolaricaulis sp.]|nr:2-dehydropantoate 2-reductase [Candidatus Bipolaricaulis sp.]